MSDVALTVDNQIFRGWKSMRVSRSIEKAAGAFALAVSERWPGQTQKWVIEPGASCQLQLDGEPVITGYVDVAERSFDSTSHDITVRGRDKAADVVDCAALLPGEKTSDLWGQNMLQDAQMLCNPYDVKIESNVSLQKLPKLSIQTTESVWETIERSARQAAVMIISDGLGGLLITRAGTEKHPAALIEGDNVLTATFTRDDSQRFSRYIMLGQSSSNEDIPAEVAAHGKAVSTDDAISRYRPIMFIVDELAPGVSMNDRVRWERNVRRGKSRRVSVTVQGFSALGRLWRPNELVLVKLPTLGIEQAELLIVSVEHMLDDQGSRTELTLSPAEAYDLLPEKPKGQKGSGAVPGVPAETARLLK